MTALLCACGETFVSEAVPGGSTIVCPECQSFFERGLARYAPCWIGRDKARILMLPVERSAS